MSLASTLARVAKAAGAAALKELLDERDMKAPPLTADDARRDAADVAQDLERLEQMAEAEYVRAKDRLNEVRRSRRPV